MKDPKMEEKNVTANSLKDLDILVKELIGQGWHVDGPVIDNKNGTFTQKMSK